MPRESRTPEDLAAFLSSGTEGCFLLEPGGRPLGRFIGGGDALAMTDDLRVRTRPRLWDRSEEGEIESIEVVALVPCGVFCVPPLEAIIGVVVSKS